MKGNVTSNSIRKPIIISNGALKSLGVATSQQHSSMLVKKRAKIGKCIEAERNATLVTLHSTDVNLENLYESF
jgi:hypothetical protein